MSPSALGTRILLAAVFLTAASALGAAVLSANALPDGPAHVVWDKAACEHCRMHLGEPAFAAQVVCKDGRVALFDDPGCLFEWLDTERPEVHATWFHELRGTSWLRGETAIFERVEQTPMGYGIGAVAHAHGDGATMTFEQANAHCLTKNSTPSGVTR